MATLTVKNSTYSSTSTSITITFTTDVNPTAVKLTKDGTNWITATTYTSNSATFNVSSWGKGTFTNCRLKVSYVEESSGGDTPGSSLTISNITGGTFTVSNNATITYTTNKTVTKHEYRMNKSYAYSDGTDKVTSSGNNHTLTFNAGELSAGTKNGSIRVTDANGNTSEGDFTLIINEATQTPDPTPDTPSTPSSGSALDDWDAFHNTYGNYVAYMADRVGVKGKSIRMTATATPTTVQGSVSKDYRSGSMVSKKAYKYGTFTFKFKISANNTLLWPMIWTLPDQTAAQDQLIGKNQRPEYDLLESWGAMTNNSVVQTYHCTTPAGESKMNYLQGRTPVDLTQEHELKLEWTQDNVVKMYCDGVVKVTIKDYVTNWRTGEVDYQVWFLNLGLGGFDGTAPNGTGWFELIDYDFQPVYTRDRVKQDYGFGRFSDGTLPSGPLPSSSGSSSGSGSVTPTPTTYTITNNLTNCTTNNQSASINANAGYTSTISANAGYELSTLTVTMGGTNITNSAVSGNTIFISKVTGNIVITANATQTFIPATYTVTRNTTNCTSTGGSTIDTSITTTFQSIVAPNDGYTLQTLTVSMGGVDYTNRPNVVTDIEWEGKPAKQITIENVNGNIVITANATQTSTSNTLKITNINALSSTVASTQINYTTNKAVTKHYFNMWYSGADSGFTDGTTKVTDNGNNNYTMTFTNELGAGTKTPAIKVEDADGNTYIKTFNLTVTA